MKKFLIAAAAFVCALVLASCGHSHEFSDKWTTDGTHHWKACTGDCTEVASKAEHDWGEPEVIEPTEEAEGSRTYTCKVCGAEKIEKIEKLPAHECYFSADWVSDADSHWHPCTAKEGCVKKGTPTAHVWGEPTVTKKPTVDAEGEKQSICTECGRTKTEKMAKLPPKMSEADWKALFAFENLKVTGELTMGDFGSSNVVYLIDGDRVHEIVDGVTSAIGREILVEMDFANYYSSFDNMGNGLYVAEEIVIEDETYGGMKLQDVQVSIKERVTKVEYDMDVLGISCHILYEFSDYGKIELKNGIDPLKWQNAFALENVTIGATVCIGDLDPQYITYYVEGDRVLILSGVGDEYADRSALTEMDLGAYRNDFTDLGDGSFGASSFTLDAEGYEGMVFNVTVEFDTDGLPAYIIYETVTEGVYITVEYSFYDWGKVSLEESMTEEAWKAAFALENVRIDGYVCTIVGDQIQDENEFSYSVDGDRVRIDDGGAITDAGREILYDLALGDYFDAFTETAPGVFEAATLKIYYDETTYDVFNDVVIAMDAEGRPASVSYLVTVEGDQIGIIYTFDGWGEIDIK